MNFFKKGDGDLPEDDKIAIQSIYGSRDGAKQWGPNSGRGRRPYQTKLTTTTLKPTTTRRFNPKPIYPDKPHRRLDSNYPPRTPEKPRYYPSIPTTHATTTRSRQHHNNQHHDKPETCNTSYDAITIIRGEIFIFKGRYLWRVGNDGLHDGYPHEITKMWSELPRDLTHVDSVYENKKRQIVFFIGESLSSN